MRTDRGSARFQKTNQMKSKVVSASVYIIAVLLTEIVASSILTASSGSGSMTVDKCLQSINGKTYNFWPLRNDERNYRVSSGSQMFLMNICGSLVDTDLISSCGKDWSACIVDSERNRVLNAGPSDALSSSAGNVHMIQEEFAEILQVSETAKCENDPQNRFISTSIRFVCDRSIAVNEQGYESVPSQPKLLKSDGCSFDFEWQTVYACSDTFERIQKLQRSGPSEGALNDACRLKDTDSDKVWDLRPLSNDLGDHFVRNDQDVFYLNFCRHLNIGGVPSVDSGAVVSHLPSTTSFKSIGLASTVKIVPFDNDQGVSYTMTDGDVCDTDSSKRYATTVKLECLPSQSLTQLQFQGKSNCEYVFKLQSKYACFVTQGDSCLIRRKDGRFVDLQPLARKNSDANYVVGGVDGVKTKLTSILTNACGNLTSNSNNLCGTGAAVCGIANGKAVVLGRIANVEDVSEGKVALTYQDGDMCTGLRWNNTRIRTKIIHSCDNGAEQPKVDLLDVTDDCQYTISFTSKQACLTKYSGGGSNDPGRSGTSGGMIFFWIVFSFILAYFAIGVAYKRFVLGYRSLDQIPNIDFWLKIWDSLNCRRQPEYSISL